MSVFDSLPKSSEIASKRKAEKDKIRAVGLAGIRGSAAQAKSETTVSLSGDEPVLHKCDKQARNDVTQVRQCSASVTHNDDGTITAPCPCGCGESITFRPSWPSASHRQRAYRQRAKRRTNAD